MCVCVCVCVCRSRIRYGVFVMLLNLAEAKVIRPRNGILSNKVTSDNTCHTVRNSISSVKVTTPNIESDGSTSFT